MVIAATTPITPNVIKTSARVKASRLSLLGREKNLLASCGELTNLREGEIRCSEDVQSTPTLTSPVLVRLVPRLQSLPLLLKNAVGEGKVNFCNWTLPRGEGTPLTSARVKACSDLTPTPLLIFRRGAFSSDINFPLFVL